MDRVETPASSTIATKPIQDRRRFLGALAGGLAALGLRSVASAPSAEAADGGPLILGVNNAATFRTRLDVTWVNGASESFYVGTNQGIAVLGSTDDQSPGVNGVSGGDGGTGVLGQGTVGVRGLSTDANGVGLEGQATGSNSSGVFGSGNIGVFGTSSTGAGLFGESSTSTAVGVIAKSDVAGGLALRVEGFPQFFSTSGRATVAAGKKTVTVTLAGVAPTDTVLATVQGSGAVSVKNATAHTDKITIAVNKASTSPVSVGYLVIRT